ncbi:uncharacterized protein M421DRAFT_417218 [Didymella exigua CBS 183.55]|uniref:Uncharacterized protein n=1 Tax=Didymella exigua CBS 183.55 TaxID=1150837 RepID=A0A6A5RZN9_9PLEO|nr:uncharacterized protein M421DRAFT_417218 [Didymella exigua CBS 183.55]KAF1932498.1 hypothetical protein M421DRAFT_417218 [Didymella exigua CBS 183.55]
MSSYTDDEWTILNLITVSQINMEQVNSGVLNKGDAPPRECTTNTKSGSDESKPKEECTCEVNPNLVRKDSVGSVDEDYRRPRRAGRVPPAGHRRYTPSPNRYYPPSQPIISTINSSTQLLERVGKEDSMVELPAPAIRNVYLTTYPFGDRDIKKWSWLFAAGIEDEFVLQSTRNMNGDWPTVERARLRNDGFIPYDSERIDIPSVCLSQALDTEVVPENTKHNVRYLIVTQKRFGPNGAKLIVVESRKAAAIQIFYNILNGDEVLFVGATVHQCRPVHPKKYKKVNSLEDAISIQDEGFVGIVC